MNLVVLFKNLSKGTLVLFAIAIGIYPLAYFLFDMSGQFFHLKTEIIKESIAWNLAFYSHILTGGLALLIGWIQFSKKIQQRYLRLHRTTGKVYFFSIIFSGLAGIYLALFATGGWIAQLGFGGLAISWLVTTILTYSCIRQKDLVNHQRWALRSYAITFAAVTLRLWLPFLGIVFHMEFLPSYQLVSWLCWVPNIVLIEIFLRTRRKNNSNPILSKVRA